MKKGIWVGFAGACALMCGQITSGGENIWTQTGPTGGAVNVQFSANPSIAFARAGDRFYKSTDGGVTWATKLTQNAETHVYALDPSNANVLIVEWGNYGLRLSTDAGETFTPIFNPVDADLVRFSPDGSVVYLLGGIPPWQLRRSTDRGTNWSNTTNNGLPVSPPPGSNLLPTASSIGIDPDDANTIYLGIRHTMLDGMYKSTDGGVNFTTNSGMFGIQVSDIIVSHGNSNHVYAATESGLYRTTNGGTSWALVPDPNGSGVASTPLRTVTIDPNNANIIYAGGGVRGEVFRSADGGATWERRGTGIVATSVSSLSVCPCASGRLLAGTSHTLYRSTDSGQNWNESANGIRAANVSQVHVGSKFYVGLYDGHVYESLNGSDWTPLNNAALRDAQPTGVSSEVRAISDLGRLFVVTSRGLTWSTDQGNTWAPRPPTFNTLNNFLPGGFLTVNGTGPVHLATTNVDVEATPDDGATWQTSSFGLPLPVPLPTRFAKNADGTQIFVGTWQHGVYKSTNGGQRWVPANTGLTGNSLYVPVLAYDDNSDVLVIGTNDGAFYTRDGGMSYTPLASPTPGTQASVVDILVEDFDHGSIYLVTYSDVYRSVDQGATWTTFTAGATPSFRNTPTSIAGDGPGRLYVGYVWGGVQNFTVAPDLELVTTAPAAGTYAIGQQVSWGATVRNNGPHAATLSRLQLQVPGNVSLRNITTSRGSCLPVTPGNLLECDLGVLQSGQSANIALNIRGEAGGTVLLDVNAFAAEVDPDDSNNRFTNSGVRFVEQVDLAATLTASAATVNSGDSFSYALTVRNNGPDTITGASFQATAPAGDQYVLAQGTTTNCGGLIDTAFVCALPPLAPGQSMSWRWNVTAVAAGARNATVAGYVNPDKSIDGNPANNSASAALNVLAANDLELVMTANSNALTRGSSVTYFLNVTNRGVIAAPAVTARLTLSAALRFNSAVGANCALGGNVVSCDLGVLSPSQLALIAITVDTLAAGATQVTAEVSGGNPDPNPANNSASAALTIAPLSDLGVTLTSAATTAVQNTAFAYTLTATNAAGSDATAATAHVTLSNLLTFASATGATCTSATNVVTCNLGSIATGGSVAVTINVNAVTVGAAASSADVVGVALDPVVINNVATAPNVTITAPPPPPPPPSSSSSSGGGKGGGGAFDYATVLALLAFIGWARRSRRVRIARD